MTERQPSQSKQILEMLGVINERLARIETKVEYQPRIDSQRFETLEKSEVVCKNNYDKILNDHDTRISTIENKPGKRWDLVITAFISSGVSALVFYLTR